jgi:hypothetical protein
MKTNPFSRIVAGGLMVVVAGCGRPAEPERATAPPAPDAPAVVPAEFQTGASAITGRVRFAGQTPTPQRIRMAADPACEALHAEPVTTRDVLVNEDGTLRNVFVYIKEGPVARPHPAPREPVVLDQVGCLYSPRVQGMLTGQPLLIRNSDETLHNVNAMPRVNPAFNIGQPRKSMETTRTFPRPEVMIPFKCDVHPWMSAYIGVLEHPYFAVTGQDGAFAFRNLPAGRYVVEAWHERFGTSVQTVTIGDDETSAIEFVFGE